MSRAFLREKKGGTELGLEGDRQKTFWQEE